MRTGAHTYIQPHTTHSILCTSDWKLSHAISILPRDDFSACLQKANEHHKCEVWRWWIIRPMAFLLSISSVCMLFFPRNVNWWRACYLNYAICRQCRCQALQVTLFQIGSWLFFKIKYVHGKKTAFLSYWLMYTYSTLKTMIILKSWFSKMLLDFGLGSESKYMGMPNAHSKIKSKYNQTSTCSAQTML